MESKEPKHITQVCRFTWDKAMQRQKTSNAPFWIEHIADGKWCVTSWAQGLIALHRFKVRILLPALGALLGYRVKCSTCSLSGRAYNSNSCSRNTFSCHTDKEIHLCLLEYTLKLDNFRNSKNPLKLWPYCRIFMWKNQLLYHILQ